MNEKVLQFQELLAVIGWETDENGNFRSNNSALDYPDTLISFIEKGDLEKLHPEDRKRCQSVFKDLFKQKKPFSLEYRKLIDAGNYHWFLDSAVPRYTQEGKFLGFFGTSTDIQDRKEKEQSFIKLGLQYQDLVENASVAIHCVNSSGFILWANNAELELLGYSSEEYIGKNITEFIIDNEFAEEMMKKLKLNKELKDFEFRIRAKDGSIKYLSMCSNVNWDRGKFMYTRCFTVDITHRKNIEEQLRERNKTLQILNSIGNTISSKLELKKLVQAVTDASTGISGAEFGAFYYNKGIGEKTHLVLYTMSGLPVHGLIGFNMPSEIMQGRYFKDKIIRFEDLIDSPPSKEVNLILPKGMPLKSYMSIPVTSRNGEILGALVFGHSQAGVFTEISELLVAGIAAQAAIAIDNARLFEAKTAGEERFRILAESIPQMIWTANPEGNIDYCNKRWMEYTGLTSEETEGMGWVQVIHKSDLVKSLKVWKKAIDKGGVYEVEYRLKKAIDSIYRWHLVRAIPIKDADGHIIKWFGTCTDIDDQKKQNQKKDDFISMASHELKTPLTSIKAYVQLLERTIKEDTIENAKVYLKKTNSYIDRLNALIADLLDVSRIQAGKLNFNMVEFSFGELVKESVESIQNTITTHTIEIISNESCMITGDKQRLEQVLNNFLTNAIKYSPGGKKVIVEVKKNRGKISIGMTDFGIGIPEEKINKVFDRFYRVETSSHKFPGLGIGLYISSEIIKRHSGKVWVESEEGKGSTFYFSIPINQNTEEN